MEPPAPCKMHTQTSILLPQLNNFFEACEQPIPTDACVEVLQNVTVSKTERELVKLSSNCTFVRELEEDGGAKNDLMMSPSTPPQLPVISTSQLYLARAQNASDSRHKNVSDQSITDGAGGGRSASIISSGRDENVCNDLGGHNLGCGGVKTQYIGAGEATGKVAMALTSRIDGETKLAEVQAVPERDCQLMKLLDEASADHHDILDATELLLGRKLHFSTSIQAPTCQKGTPNGSIFVQTTSGAGAPAGGADHHVRSSATFFQCASCVPTCTEPKSMQAAPSQLVTQCFTDDAGAVSLELNIGPACMSASRSKDTTAGAFSPSQRLEAQKSQAISATHSSNTARMPHWLKRTEEPGSAVKRNWSEALMHSTTLTMAILDNPNNTYTGGSSARGNYSGGILHSHIGHDKRSCTLGLCLDCSNHGGGSGTRNRSTPRPSCDSKVVSTHARMPSPSFASSMVGTSTGTFYHHASLPMPFPRWLVPKPSPPHDNLSTADLLQVAFPKEVTSQHLQNRSSGELEFMTLVSRKQPESELINDHANLFGQEAELEAEARPSFNRAQSENARDDLSTDAKSYVQLNKSSDNETPSIHEKALVEFLRAKKQNKEHYLDKIVVNADVYQRHPWHYTWGDVQGSLYFCCITKYSRRGNMTRDRMTKEGGRWKQQGMVQPILTARGYGAASKTYLSYIPRGKNNSKGYFIPATPGRVKHRHRMIEIALEEDLHSEKENLKLKVTPNPFLVICVLRKT